MNERSDAELAIELRGVTRVFPGPVNALRGVDLKVAYNESVAITGPSGCGKSTLLHLLAAIDKPTAGTVSVAGQNVDSLHDPSHFRRSEVGLVFQFHNLLPQLNALANIELPMFGTVRSAHARKERAQSLLEDVDLVVSSSGSP
jgi:putative ABC transport system ATP-binding protein